MNKGHWWIRHNEELHHTIMEGVTEGHKLPQEDQSFTRIVIEKICRDRKLFGLKFFFNNWHKKNVCFVIKLENLIQGFS